MHRLLCALLGLTACQSPADLPYSPADGLAAFRPGGPCYDERTAPDTALAPFYHGVASGDPLPDRVIVWTRVTPAPAPSEDTIAVAWEVAPTPDFARVVRRGHFRTSAARDYTVKVDVTGLRPDTYYYYRFRAGDRASPVGRTRTAPALGATVDSLRFALLSCVSIEAGYFHAYRAVAAIKELNAVVHLGDYLYEYGPGGYIAENEQVISPCPPQEITTLEDYRTRHAQYKLDPDTRAVHQQHPFFLLWDDHEFADNAWPGGAGNHNEITDPLTRARAQEGPWSARVSAALRAYYEWMPVRETEQAGNYRAVRYGTLADLIALDTRMAGRDAPTELTVIDTSDERSLLGAAQMGWLTERLGRQDGQWKIIAQQVMMAPLALTPSDSIDERLVVNPDQWDGYPAERDRLFGFLADAQVPNVVVLTGDIHTAWANDLPLRETSSQPGYDAEARTGSVGVEVVCPSVTSPGLPELATYTGVPLIRAVNPHVRFADITRQGFVVLTVRPNFAQADWFFVSPVTVADFDVVDHAGWRVIDGTPSWRETTGPVVPYAALTRSPVPLPETP